MSYMKQFLWHAVICSVILILLTVAWMAYYFNASGPLVQERQVIIKRGTSIKNISLLLAEEGVISHPYIFSTILYFSKLGRKLKPGEYIFSPWASPMRIYQKLAAGDTVVHRLTIPEGLMTSQILELIRQAPYLEGELTEEVPEGALLPETYVCNYGDGRNDIVKRMQKAMEHTIDELWEKRTVGDLVKDKEQAIIIASIIEKETRLEAERKRVAAVFINRLKKNMKLQMDPTVIYAITKGKSVLDRSLSQKDLEIDDPYNTYKYVGLPPGPITNPGKAAIEAALNPEATEDIYFVADGTGGHKFAKTLQEHQKNVKQWRKINQ
jgi:UPF0755 protein